MFENDGDGNSANSPSIHIVHPTTHPFSSNSDNVFQWKFVNCAYVHTLQYLNWKSFISAFYSIIAQHYGASVFIFVFVSVGTSILLMFVTLAIQSFIHAWRYLCDCKAILQYWHTDGSSVIECDKTIIIIYVCKMLQHQPSNLTHKKTIHNAHLQWLDNGHKSYAKWTFCSPWQKSLLFWNQKQAIAVFNICSQWAWILSHLIRQTYRRIQIEWRVCEPDRIGVEWILFNF